MEIDELITLGKLGFNDIIKGWIPIRLNPDFQKYLENLTKAFLIFTDHRVRYVTISKVKFIKGKWYLKIAEPEIYLEAQNQGYVTFAVDDDILYPEDEDYYDPIGMEVFSDSERIGIISDWFNNGAQDILVIKSENGKEVLIPEVEEFISEIDIEHKIIRVKNISSFLDL